MLRTTNPPTSYETAKERRHSIYTSPTGQQYFPNNASWYGAYAEVRLLMPEDKTPPSLVVKRMQKDWNSGSGEQERNYLLAAYPTRKDEIQYFVINAEEGVYRLVMPYFGNKTLEEILQTPGNSLNHRYTLYLKAIAELQRLHVNNIAHGDANPKHILFDDKEDCYYIHGKLDKTQTEAQRQTIIEKDIRIFKSSISLLKCPLAFLSDDIINGIEKIYAGHFYLRINKNRNALEYHVINIHGKHIRNKITFNELKDILDVAPYQRFTQAIQSCGSYSDEHLKPFLPYFLEITSKREETPRYFSTYVSKDFLAKLSEVETLIEMTRIITGEMIKNQEIVAEMLRDIKTELLSGIEVAIANSNYFPVTGVILMDLQAQVGEINIEHLNENSEYQVTDKITRELMHLLYQAEHFTSHESWTARFIGRQNPAYAAAKPHFEEIREILRLHLMHLPELPVSLKDVLYSRNPTYCKTYAQYEAETVKHAVSL